MRSSDFDNMSESELRSETIRLGEVVVDADLWDAANLVATAFCAIAVRNGVDPDLAEKSREGIFKQIAAFILMGGRLHHLQFDEPCRCGDPTCAPKAFLVASWKDEQ